MSRNTWIIFSVVVVLLFGGLIYLSVKDRVDVSNVSEMSLHSADKQSGNIGDHVYGSKASKVILLEYGDYQCPGCGAAYPALKKVTEKYKGKLTFVFRNFPLTSMHPNAKAAAAAVEAAGLSGKYWEMHNVLYENQNSWTESSGEERNSLFTTYAVQAGVDEQAFKKALTDDIDNINRKIDFDIALAKKSGASGTPTIFLNGKPVDQKVKDGKIVDTSEDVPYIWSDADALDKLLIKPALQEAGLLKKSKK